MDSYCFLKLNLILVVNEIAGVGLCFVYLASVIVLFVLFVGSVFYMLV